MVANVVPGRDPCGSRGSKFTQQIRTKIPNTVEILVDLVDLNRDFKAGMKYVLVEILVDLNLFNSANSCVKAIIIINTNAIVIVF